MTDSAPPIEDALARIEVAEDKGLNAAISFDRDTVISQAKDIASRTSATRLNG